MAALLALVALAAAPTFVAGAELYAPNLKFNWTLRPFDGPLEFTGWEPAGNLAGGWVRASGYIGGSAGVEFIGTGLSFNGRGSNWGRTDSNGLPDPAGYAYVTGDPTWANTDTDRGLLQPASDSVLWQRSTPRFQEYKMSIQAFYGNWTFESATVTTGMNASDEVTSLDEVPRTIVNFVGSDGQVNTTFFSTTGRWEVTPASDQLPEHVTCYDDAVVRVHIPPGTGFMVINGTRSTASRTLYLKIAPIDDELDQQTYTIDATFGYTTEAVLFILPIDTNTPQLLIMDCVLSGQGQQGLTTITFYGDSTTGSSGTGAPGSTTSGDAKPSSSSTPTGVDGSTNSDGGSSKSGLSKTAIIGIIVAVVVVALIGLLAWALIAWRRRRAARPPRPAPHNGMPAYQSGPLAGEIDPNVYPTPYSYQSQQPMVNYFDKPGGNPDNAPPPSYITTPVNNGSPGVYKY